MSKFFSPTQGQLTFDEMFREILRFMDEDPEGAYKVIVHRLGKGARFFYQRRRQEKILSLRQRIFYEASLSLGLAGRLADRLAGNGHAGLDVEIHLDVGKQGETRDLIREVVGMITGSGFDAKIKPDSYGASKVADKYTK